MLLLKQIYYVSRRCVGLLSVKNVHSSFMKCKVNELELNAMTFCLSIVIQSRYIGYRSNNYHSYLELNRFV